MPVNALLAQCAWSSVLALSGSFDTLTDYVIFAAWIFYALNAASVFILRRRLPDAERPYRTIGYPVVPLIFIAVAGWLIANTIIATPRQALTGLGNHPDRPANLRLLDAQQRERRTTNVERQNEERRTERAQMETARFRTSVRTAVPEVWLRGPLDELSTAADARRSRPAAGTGRY